MGLVKTPKGSVCLNNENIIKLPTYKRAQKGIGYVPQEGYLPQLTVHEILFWVWKETVIRKVDRRGNI